MPLELRPAAVRGAWGALRGDVSEWARGLGGMMSLLEFDEDRELSLDECYENKEAVAEAVEASLSIIMEQCTAHLS